MEPLDMSRFPGRGELHVERSALSGRGPHVNLSRVFLDDSVAYRETKARAPAVGLGGEERIEDAVNVFARNSCAGIRDFDFDAAVVRAGADFEHPSTRHGIARVQKQIQEYLLQLVGGAMHGRQRLAKFFHYLNTRGF